MRRRQIFTFLGSIAITLLLAISYGQTTATPLAATKQAKTINLTVSAAISLTNAMQDIQGLYRQSRPNVTLTFNFGSSGALQQQIERGAPADVFFSAAEKQMDALDSANLLLPGTRQNLLGNRVVLATPRNSALSLSSFRELTSPQVRRIAIGEPKSVPAGQYAQEVLTSIGLFEQLKPKIIFGQNVRQVLTYVETGNVDAGIVYTTDAKQSKQVRVVATAPTSTHSPIIYPVAVIRRSQNATAARDFVTFLASAQAKAVFERYGFTTP